jgi:hypothetical protein
MTLTSYDLDEQIKSLERKFECRIERLEDKIERLEEQLDKTNDQFHFLSPCKDYQYYNYTNKCKECRANDWYYYYEGCSGVYSND